MLVIVLALVGGIAFLVIRKLRGDNTVTYDAYTTSIGTISNSLSYSGSMQLINSATYTADEKVLVRDVLHQREHFRKGQQGRGHLHGRIHRQHQIPHDV